MKRIAVLDDWQNRAESLTDWSGVLELGALTFFQDAFADENDAVEQLTGFDAVVAMRERTPFPASLIARLPNLKLLSFTGAKNAAVDIVACTEAKVQVCYTTGKPLTYATAELALGLMLAASRQIAFGDAEIRAGRFQENLIPGTELFGKTLGIIGLGKLGGRLARYANALEMNVLAWSQNLTAEKAAEAGATLVSKQELLERADVVSLHLVLSDRSRLTLGAAEIATLKPGTIVINTSRAGLIDQGALLAAATAGKIVAALDVFTHEPMMENDPWRTAPNTVLTPHLGYVTQGNMSALYKESAENLVAWLKGAPIRTMNEV